MIEQLFVPAVVVLSTLFAFVAARRRYGWSSRAAVPAFGKVLECVGAAVVFCVLNGLVGALVIVIARAVSGRFVSLYLGADHTLIALSALQALAFQWWRESARR